MVEIAHVSLNRVRRVRTKLCRLSSIRVVHDRFITRRDETGLKGMLIVGTRAALDYFAKRVLPEEP